ncbi:hypothetical protein SAMN05720354_10150 [Nitrosospira sp. Nsp1]|nr:hypothetical protein SAMN05720354_10150 [Nitrosospira sp. Nsp1]
MTTKSRKTKAKSHKLFPDELIDQLLPQIQNKDAGSILGESKDVILIIGAQSKL